MRMEDFQNSIFINTFVSCFNLVIIYQTQSRRSFSFVAYYLQSTRGPDSVSGIPPLPHSAFISCVFHALNYM